MSPELGHSTNPDQQTYMRDITNPRYGECNTTAYDLLTEMKEQGLISEGTSDQHWLMCSGYPDTQRWIDLRALKLTLGGWRGFHGVVAMDVKKGCGPADLIKVYETARRLAQERDLTVFVVPSVGYSYLEPPQKLDDFLKGSNESNIQIPDLIGFLNTSIHKSSRPNF